MSDFADRPLYTTPVIGLRAFRIEADHHLTGPIVRNLWTPGENTAVCSPFNPSRFLDPDDPVFHEPGSMTHGCGFYAYYDGRNDHAIGPHRIAGIIAGYGTVTAGSRGFRASKARILALVRVGNHVGCNCSFEQQTEAIAANYPGVPWYTTEAEALEAHPLTNPADLGIEPPENEPVMPHARHVHINRISGVVFARSLAEPNGGWRLLGYTDENGGLR